MPSLRRLNGPFGMEAERLDLSGTLEERAMASVLDAFYEQHLLVIRNQELDRAQFTALCRSFGRPKAHLLDHLRLPGFPDILVLSNIHENGKPIGIYEGASFWHTDVAYEDPPNSSTIAYSILVPEVPVALEIASLALAYDALAETMKRRIDSFSVLHRYGNRDDLDESSPYSAEKLNAEQKSKLRSVYQPLVLKHPVTGRKSLYAVAGSSFGIRGMPDDEALSLLDELKMHALQPQFIQRHQYQVGDVVAWDTLATLHKAPLTPPATGERDRRLLWRISVTGQNDQYMQSLRNDERKHG